MSDTSDDDDIPELPDDDADHAAWRDDPLHKDIDDMDDDEVDADDQEVTEEEDA